MPIRATIAVVATVVVIALMASFKTPALVTVHPSRPAAIGSPPPDGGGGSATAGSSPSPSAAANGLRDGSYDGTSVSTRYGDVQVRVVISGGRITNVVALSLPSDLERSAEISQQAGPLLHDEAVQAQSAQIDTLGGATYTSFGYAQSLQSALDKAHG